jgi:hypothetical protein
MCCDSFPRTMHDDDSEYSGGIDRMDHPLSHIAAVVGGVACIMLIGCLALLLSDSRMLRSTTWWSVFALAAAMVTVCLIGYFNPRSRLIYVPVLIAGVVSFGICVYHLLWSLDSRDNPSIVPALIRSGVVFFLWIGWALQTVLHLWYRRL